MGDIIDKDDLIKLQEQEYKDELNKLKNQDIFNKVFNPSDVSARLRAKLLQEEKELREETQRRLNEYNGRANNVVTNETRQVTHNEQNRTIVWNSEKILDSTIRELLSIKVNLMKEAIESLGIEFQDTIQYGNEFVKYDNQMIDGPFDGEPSHETIDTAIVVLFASTMNGEFPIPPLVLSYIKDMLAQGYILEQRISMLLSHESTLERGKAIVQSMIDAGISNYVAIAIAGALFVESGWKAVKCPEQTEFGGLIAKKHVKLNSTGHNWADAGEGLFGLTFWNAKEHIINDPDFAQLREKYRIPNVFEEYNEDLAAGRVDTMYVTQWKGTSVEASGHLSNLELDEWGIPLKIFLRRSRFWKDVFEKTDEHDKLIAANDIDYLTSCLAASYLFKAGGKDPTYEEGKYRSYVYRKQHDSMNYRVQDGWATQMIVSIALSKYIKGEPVKTFDELVGIINNM